MPADALVAAMAPEGPASEPARARRQALRIGLAAAVGLVLGVVSGSPLPFLAPLFAVQFLVASRQPMRPGQAIGMVLLIACTGQGLSLGIALADDRPFVVVALLWLLYLACFVVQARGRGAQASFLVLVVGVMVPLMEILRLDLGSPMSMLLAAAVAGGALLAWVAHAAIPDTGDASAPAPPSPTTVGLGLHRPVANASILLAAVVVCLVDSRLSSAVVIPVTVASVLGQADLARSGRAALGLVAVNILGGVTASLAFAVVALRPTMTVLFLIVLAAGLLFGARAVDLRAGKVYAGALTIFLILLGLGISPLPVSTPESFTSRIAYVLAAVLCTLWACLLLWPAQSIGPGRQPDARAQI